MFPHLDNLGQTVRFIYVLMFVNVDFFYTCCLINTPGKCVFSQQLAYRPNSTEHKCESRKATPGLHAARLVLMYVRRPGLIGLRQIHKYNNTHLQKYAKTHIQKYTNTYIQKYANTCGPVGLDVCPPRLAGPNRPPNGLLQGSAVHGFGDLY